LITASQIWWLNGDWDRLEKETADWFLDQDPTSSNGRMCAMRTQVELARGREPTSSVLVASEYPLDENANVLVRSLEALQTGGLIGAAAAVAASTLSAFSAHTHMMEDFEVMLAPTVELQLQAGDLAMADRLLSLADPLLSGRGRAITRAEVPRLRGMLAIARGEDPEADLRAAAAAHEAYGAPYLLALTRYELARWLFTHGGTKEAELLLDEARETFARLGAVPALEKTDALRSETVGSGMP
jgi:hypothetical protein